MTGERALAAHAYDEAIGHFENAREATPSNATEAETANLLFGLARAELGARELFDVGHALEYLCQAFDLFVDADEPQKAVEVVAQPLPPVYETTELPERIARALELADTVSLEHGRLLVNAGWFAGTHEADYDRARDAFERSLSIARNLGDTSLEGRALLSSSQVDYWHLDWQGCWENGLKAAELAARNRDQHGDMLASEWIARVALVRGEPRQARAQMATALELAEKLRERSWLGTTHVMGAIVSMLEGDWAAARGFSDRGLALQPREPRNLAIRALIEAQVGGSASSDAYLERLLDPARRSAWGQWDRAAVASFIPLIGRLTGETTSYDLAGAEGNAALASSAAPFQRELWPRIGLGLIASHRNDPDATSDHYAWLKQQQGTAVMGLGLAVDRLLGILASSMGDHGAAAQHFDDSLGFCSRAGYHPELAWTASDYAQLLLEPSTPAARDRARDLLDSSLETARELEMHPLIERISGQREALRA